MFIEKLIWTILLVISFVSQPILADDELEKKLNEVNKLRTGFSTPFDEVEKRCNELLQKYTLPEDQGRIYYMMAHVEGQSGLQRPKKILKYIEKALGLTQDRVKRAQLYMYQGNAIEVMNRGVRGKDLMAPRELATKSYLKSIHESCERISELKAIVVEDTYDQEIQKMGRANNKLLTQAKHAKAVRDREIENLMGFNDAFIEQTSYLYSRFPFDTENLEKLATEVIKDKAILEKLLTKVRARVQERTQKFQNEIMDEQLVTLNNEPEEFKSNLNPPKITQPVANSEKENLEDSSKEVSLPQTEDSGLSTLSVVGFIVFASAVLIAIIIWLRKINKSREI